MSNFSKKEARKKAPHKDEAVDFIKSRVHVGADTDNEMDELSDTIRANVTLRELRDKRKNLLMFAQGRYA
jgi:hypothetical protein